MHRLDIPITKETASHDQHFDPKFLPGHLLLLRFSFHALKSMVGLGIEGSSFLRCAKNFPHGPMGETGETKAKDRDLNTERVKSEWLSGSSVESIRRSRLSPQP